MREDYVPIKWSQGQWNVKEEIPQKYEGSLRCSMAHESPADCYIAGEKKNKHSSGPPWCEMLNRHEGTKDRHPLPHPRCEVENPSLTDPPGY